MKTLVTLLILIILILSGCEKESNPFPGMPPILLSPSIDAEITLPIYFAWQGEADEYWLIISKLNPDLSGWYDIVAQYTGSDLDFMLDDPLENGLYHWSVEARYKSEAIGNAWSGHRKFIIK